MWRSFLFPTRTVGTLKIRLKICLIKKKVFEVAIRMKMFNKLTESFQPCLAACHEEPAQLQN